MGHSERLRRSGAPPGPGGILATRTAREGSQSRPWPGPDGTVRVARAVRTGPLRVDGRVDGGTGEGSRPGEVANPRERAGRATAAAAWPRVRIRPRNRRPERGARYRAAPAPPWDPPPEGPLQGGPPVVRGAAGAWGRRTGAGRGKRGRVRAEAKASPPRGRRWPSRCRRRRRSPSGRRTRGYPPGPTGEVDLGTVAGAGGMAQATWSPTAREVGRWTVTATSTDASRGYAQAIVEVEGSAGPPRPDARQIAGSPAGRRPGPRTSAPATWGRPGSGSALRAGRDGTFAGGRRVPWTSWRRPGPPVPSISWPNP
jgi:hypothetical protein